MTEKELFIDYKSMHCVYAPKDVPEEGERYAILEFGRVTVAGWDQNDPPSIEPKINVVIFADREAWEHEIRRKLQNKFGDPYEWVPITLKRAKLETSIVVQVQP